MSMLGTQRLRLYNSLLHYTHHPNFYPNISDMGLRRVEIVKTGVGVMFFHIVRAQLQIPIMTQK